MHLRLSAIVCAVRAHGETAAIARLLTHENGLIACYVAGGRGRKLRPVVIPGNLVEVELRARSPGQLAFGRLELIVSRGPWLGEPLAAAAINWATALTTSVLPEEQAYPVLYEALLGLLDAICHGPSARGWTAALVRYETLVLRELGYGTPQLLPAPGDFPANLAVLDRLGRDLARYALADRRSDVMAARIILRERLGRID
ncbi:MAG: recombination protein O N-terminal domain-containing protein [Pseudomonadota bacterium]